MSDELRGQRAAEHARHRSEGWEYRAANLLQAGHTPAALGMGADHRTFVALLAPVGVWSEDGRRLSGEAWSVRDRAPILEPSTRDPVGYFTGVGRSPVGLVGVGLLDLTGVYLAGQGLILEVDFSGDTTVTRVDWGHDFSHGTVTGATFGKQPMWPDVWLRLDEQACARCWAPTGVDHGQHCNQDGATT